MLHNTMSEGTQKNSGTSTGNTTEDEEQSYGWFGYEPNCFQLCLSSRFILVCLCLLVGTQSFVASGLSSVVITTIERRYFLQSSKVGAVLSCNQIGGIVLTLIVSYYGHRHKPKWLGLGSFVLGLGCLTFALPKLLIDTYKPITEEPSDLCHYNPALLNATNNSVPECKSSKWYHLLVFGLGQLVIGAGASPIYNLGAAYLDENVSHKNSGVYLGIFYAISLVGAGAGYILGGYFLTIYVDVTMPEGVHLKQGDNGWIGAWWLGYLFAGGLALLTSVLLLGFPSQIPAAKMLQEEKKKASDCVPDEAIPHTTKRLWPDLKSLFKNKVFVFTSIAGTAEGLAISGSSTFFPKFLQSQYSLRASDASFYAGLVIIPSGTLGMLLGGYLIRRFQWTCAQCTKACSIIAFLALFPIFIILVHCPNKSITGVTTPYFNRTSHGPLDVCSKLQNCSCNENKYIPVCSKEDQATYFSPCHAGCTTEIKRGNLAIYTNCSCLPPNITEVYNGGCDQSCNSMGYFLAIVFLFIVFTFLNNTPAVTVVLRCVPESQGSFALGVTGIITKIFAFIPAPIIYGALLDNVCILSETDPCDEDDSRNCLEYKNENLSYVLFGATMVCKVISFLFFTLSWLVYRPPKNPMENNFLMT